MPVRPPTEKAGLACGVSRAGKNGIDAGACGWSDEIAVAVAYLRSDAAGHIAGVTTDVNGESYMTP